MNIKEKYMKEALKEARKAVEKDEVPIGAVIVYGNKIIARGHNVKELKKDTTKHAEMIAIQKASKKLDSWRLEDCEMYVTLEPCPMCAWAILQSRIKSVYFGSYDLQYGALGSKLNLSQLSSSKLHVKGGFMEEECDKILRDFFKRIRNDNKR